MTRSLDLLLMISLGCGAQRAESGDVADEGVSSGESDSLDTSEPPLDFPPDCTPSSCVQQCWAVVDECGWGLDGVCMADTCVCQPNADCLPCEGQVCASFEVCGSWGREGEFGTCHLPCSGSIDFVWAAAAGCTIELPAGFPIGIEPYMVVEIAGMTLPKREACGEPEYLEAVMFDPPSLTVTLCEDACALFESEGTTGRLGLPLRMILAQAFAAAGLATCGACSTKPRAGSTKSTSAAARVGASMSTSRSPASMSSSPPR